MPVSATSAPTLTPQGGVRLRAHTDADIDRIVEQVVDAKSRTFTAVPVPYDTGDAAAFLDSVRQGWCDGTLRQWAVEADGRFAGTVNYRLEGPGGEVAEIGYGLHPDARGRGLATAAVRSMLDWAFGTDGVRLMHWRAAVGNFDSRWVAWRCGFTVDGRLREAHLAGDGTRRDLWLGSLAAGEPRRPAHPWWQPRALTGERVRLRAWTSADRPETEPDELATAFADGMQPTPRDFDDWLAERRCRMADGSGVYWCVADPDTDRPLGGIQLHELDRRFSAGTGLLGYFLFPADRGRGLLADAVELVVEHAFADRGDDTGHDGIGLHRLFAGTDIDNRASQRLLRRAGFRECARERSVLAHPDRPPTSAVSFELLAGDDRVSQTVEPCEVRVLITERLRLRAWTRSDTPGHDRELDAAALRYLPAGAQPTAETFDDWLRRRRRELDSGRAVPWCIADRDTDVPLGSIGVFGIDDGAPGNAEVGYWLFADARRRGAAGEALAAVIAHAFTPAERGGLGLHRLHAGTDVENIPSRRVLERAGFRCWGTDRQAHARADGSLSDGAYYELLAADR